MKNEITVNWWTKIDDDRAENLNGGNGTSYLNICIGGDVDVLQLSGDDRLKLKLYPIGEVLKHYGVHLYKCRDRS
jgi:hypothetical protein